MSLEEELRANTAAILAHNDLLRQMLGAKAALGNKAADAKDEPEEKPATRRRRSSTKDEPEEKPAPAKAKGPTPEEAKTYVADWIGEFDEKLYDDNGDQVDDADEKLLRKRKARFSFVKKCYAKLGVESVKELEDAKDRKQLIDWIEQKKGGEDPFEGDED